MRVFSFVRTKIKIKRPPQKSKKRKMTKTVTEVKDNGNNIQEMLPMTCDEIFKRTCTISTKKVTLLMRKSKIRQHCRQQQIKTRKEFQMFG